MIRPSATTLCCGARKGPPVPLRTGLPPRQSHTAQPASSASEASVIGQHQGHKGAHPHAAAAIQIEVLGVADGGQHTAQVGRDGLHTHHRQDQFFPRLGAQAVQDHKGKGHEGEQRHIIGDEHTAKKAQPHQHQDQLQSAARQGQQGPAHPVKDPLLPQPGHHGHQRKEDGQGTEVDVAEIRPIRGYKKGREQRQDRRHRKDGLLFDESYQLCHDSHPQKGAALTAPLPRFVELLLLCRKEGAESAVSHVQVVLADHLEGRVHGQHRPRRYPPRRSPGGATSVATVPAAAQVDAAQLADLPGHVGLVHHPGQVTHLLGGGVRWRRSCRGCRCT